MIRKILVPLDGTPLAETALPFARTLARCAGASLTLVRAAQYSSLLSDVAGNQYRVISVAEDYLASLAERLATEGLSVECGVPFGGSPAEWIVEESEVRRIDLVIMATHDREGADRWVHGSVAESVVHDSKVPVMLVHPADAEAIAARFENHPPVVVVTLDGSETSECALAFAGDFARVIGARMQLVGVVSREDQEDATRAYLTAQADLFNSAGVSTDSVVRLGDAASEIIAVVDQYAPAAVVMGTHGRTGVVRAVLGSVSGAVLHHTSMPVVLTRPIHVRAVEPAGAAR